MRLASAKLGAGLIDNHSQNRVQAIPNTAAKCTNAKAAVAIMN
jgi:hypothetical protein